MIATAIVDAGALGQLVWVGLLAGLVLVTAFSLAIFGAARASAERRQSRPGPTAVYLLLCGASGAVCLASVALGVAAMLHKG